MSNYRDITDGDRFNRFMNSKIPEWMTSELAIAEQEGRLRFYVVVYEENRGGSTDFIDADYQKAKKFFDSLKDENKLNEPLFASLRVTEIISGNENDGYEFDNDVTIEIIDNLED